MCKRATITAKATTMTKGKYKDKGAQRKMKDGHGGAGMNEKHPCSSMGDEGG